METLAAISPAAWYNIGLIVVVVSMVAMIVVAYRAWAEAHEDVEPISPSELLASFEEARAAGELDDEEYRRVQERIHEADKRPGGKP